MKDRVFGIIASIFGCPPESVNEKSSPDSIESWDSLNHMKLILALEEEFDIEFTDDQIINMISGELILSTLREFNIQ